MDKNTFIQNISTLIWWEVNLARVELLINSALAFVNGYTFQNFSIYELSTLPADILSIVSDLIVMKYHDKGNIQSERISDYAISYSTSDLSEQYRSLLNRYVIYHVE